MRHCRWRWAGRYLSSDEEVGSGVVDMRCQVLFESRLL
jgi:hypothetical protein